MTKAFAHRGFSSKYPENTMLAFKKAIELGADGLETDIHFTKDKQIVMIHDENLYRTVGVKGFVSDYTLEELRQFDASYKAVFGDKFSNNPIPTLREYFEMVSKEKDFITNIEIKTDNNEYPGIEKALVELIDEFSLRQRIVISSFNHYSVMRFKALAPDVKCGFLLGDWIIDVGQYAKKHGIECVHPNYHNLTDECYKEMRDAGRQVNTWTVNSYADIERLIKMGVDIIMSDCPDKTLEALNRLK
ncbi:MAG: glycerophosphodiester phosphodiesterase [Clostridia bacterium]|nr:glycerophosphodiester phosphodiesterase [Clostridia bacterium]